MQGTIFSILVYNRHLPFFIAKHPKRKVYADHLRERFKMKKWLTKHQTFSHRESLRDPASILSFGIIQNKKLHVVQFQSRNFWIPFNSFAHGRPIECGRSSAAPFISVFVFGAFLFCLCMLLQGVRLSLGFRGEPRWVFGLFPLVSTYFGLH